MGRISTVSHRTLKVNGIEMHIAEQGEGPLILLLHGFPESAYSWRNQLAALAEAGFHAVAPDQRGYARSTCPAAVEQYTILHLVGDVVGLIQALGEETAVVVGHDFGAPVAWATALMRPDVVRGVVGMSVPPQGAFFPIRRSAVPPVEAYREQLGDSFYVVAFQEPGQAEELLGDDRAASLRGMISGANAAHGTEANIDDEHRPDEFSMTLPDGITEDDIAVFAAEFEERGFTGGLNWYRNLDRNWELMAPWDGATITPPLLYLLGDRDNVPAFIPIPSIEELREIAPRASDIVRVPDCGHWTQQEQPEVVSRAIIDFVRTLD